MQGAASQQKESRDMFRSLVLSAAVATSALVVHAQMKPDAAAPANDARVGKVIEVKEANRAPERCVILQVWRTPEGNTAMLARGMDSGEFVTIVEYAQATGGDRFRTFRWGQSAVAPLGSPVPPLPVAQPESNAASSIVIIQGPATPPTRHVSPPPPPIILPTAQQGVPDRVTPAYRQPVIINEAPRAQTTIAAPPLLTPPARNVPVVVEQPRTATSNPPVTQVVQPVTRPSTPVELPNTIVMPQTPTHMNPPQANVRQPVVQTMPVQPPQRPTTATTPNTTSAQRQWPSAHVVTNEESKILPVSHQQPVTPQKPAVTHPPVVQQKPATLAPATQQKPPTNSGTVVPVEATTTAPLAPPAVPTPSVGVMSGDKVGDVIPLVVNGKRDLYRVLKRQRGASGVPTLVVQSTTTNEVVTISQDLGGEVKTEVVSSVILPPAEPTPPLKPTTSTVPNVIVDTNWKPTPTIVTPTKPMITNPTATIPTINPPVIANPTKPANPPTVVPVDHRNPVKPTNPPAVVQADLREPAKPTTTNPNKPSNPPTVVQADLREPAKPTITNPTKPSNPPTVVQADLREPVKPTDASKPSPIQQTGHNTNPIPDVPPLKPIDKPTTATKPTEVQKPIETATKPTAPNKPAFPETLPPLPPETPSVSSDKPKQEKPTKAEDVDFRRSWEDPATTRNQGRLPPLPTDPVTPAQFRKPVADHTPPENDPLRNPEAYVRRNPSRELIGEPTPNLRNIPPQRPLPPLPPVNSGMGTTTPTQDMAVPQPHVPLATTDARPPLPPPQPSLNRYDTIASMNSRDPYHPSNAGMIARPQVPPVSAEVSPTAWTRGPLPATPQSPVLPAQATPTNPDERAALILKNTMFLTSVLQSSGSPAQRDWAAARLEVVDPTAYPFAVEALVTAAKTDPVPAVRVRAIRTLGLMGASSPSVMNMLEQARKDADPRIREQAIQSSQLLGTPATSTVVPAVHEPRDKQ
jgi:hypothetical protein